MNLMFNIYRDYFFCVVCFILFFWRGGFVCLFVLLFVCLLMFSFFFLNHCCVCNYVWVCLNINLFPFVDMFYSLQALSLRDIFLSDGVN